jgi:hypothetical protein
MVHGVKFLGIEQKTKYFSIEKLVDRVHGWLDPAAPWSTVDHGQGCSWGSPESSLRELLRNEEVAGNLTDGTEGGGEA